MRSSLLDALAGERGYFTGWELTSEELACVRAAIEAQWRAVLCHSAPEHADQLARRGIARYHELAHLVDHAGLWPKRTRLLPPPVVAEIRRTSLFRRLTAELGPFAISAEEGSGSEEIYWRLTRPHQPADIGPLHADAWFWELGDDPTPPGCSRVKVWVAVITEPGRNGLRLAPGSHRRAWRYHGEWRDGKRKPVLDEPEDHLDLELVPTPPGAAVVFHDRLLHGGALNRGERTRVSFELTLFLPTPTR